VSNHPFPFWRDERAAAEMLGISHRTLQAWRVKGGGPPFVKLGRSVRYELTQLEAWANARVRANTSGS
jgi:excisionase family DNA binding protein